MQLALGQTRVNHVAGLSRSPVRDVSELFRKESKWTAPPRLGRAAALFCETLFGASADIDLLQSDFVKSLLEVLGCANDAHAQATRLECLERE